MLTFQHVSLSLGKTEILKNLNFEILPGEIVAILGASGAGKSSVFRLLTAEQRPTLGKITLDSTVLGDLDFNSVQDYRQQIGIIFQDYRLLNQKTVFENIAFALEVCGHSDIIPKRVPELIKLVGLESKENTFPKTLSGGEKQRVAIARSLAHNPIMLIADEATGNLDPKNARSIADLLLKLNKERGLTILLATHDPVLVEQIKPRVIRLEKGRIILDKKNCPAVEAFKGLL